jgi:predicted ester cyclase
LNLTQLKEDPTVTPAERAARAVFDALNGRDFEALRDLVTADFVDHGLPPGVVPPGPDGYIATLRWVAEVLSIRYEVHEIVGSGDLVAIRATAHGVHNSGHLGFAPTGKPYAMATMHLYRADGDRLAEHWGVRDELSVLWQVGALPTPPLPDLSTAPA